MPLARLRDHEEPAPNLTPMIDVVLVLTIFFMCATRFSGDERQFDLELPSVSSALPVAASRPQLLEVTAEGDVRLAGEEMPLKDLPRRLTELRTARPDVSLLIRGDRAVSHGRMAEVYEACRLADIRRLGISVKSRAGGPKVVR